MPNRLKNRFFPSIMTGALAIIAITGVADARQRKPDSYVPSGAPVDCVPMHSVRNTNVLDDKTIDFEIGFKKIYRNTLPQSCPSLGSEGRFLIENRIDQLCSVDTVTVLHSFGNGLSRGATCGLGKFQPMVKAAK